MGFASGALSIHAFKAIQNRHEVAIFNFISLCFLAVLVFGDLESSTNPNLNPSPSSIPSPAEYFATLFKGLEDRIRELEKSQEEVKDLKLSHAKSKEEIKSLKEKLEQLEQRISNDHGVWLLTPPLRGPPGRKGDKGDPGPIALQSITSCSDAMEFLPSPRSQKQRIYPHGNNKIVEVLCDFETDGGGWTLIQKRTSGPLEEFQQNWANYTQGFGSLDKNFWIGLNNIHALTQNGDQELRIELEDFEGEKRWATYSNFSVSDALDFYRLSISGYSGDAGNDMFYSTEVQNRLQFSTKDKDNDKWSANCADHFGGGWWFKDCFSANLNGLYREKGETVPYAQGLIWYSWKGFYYSLAKTEMKIRTRK